MLACGQDGTVGKKAELDSYRQKVEEYNQIIPMDYKYSFNNIEDYEQSSYNNGL